MRSFVSTLARPDSDNFEAISYLELEGVESFGEQTTNELSTVWARHLEDMCDTGTKCCLERAVLETADLMSNDHLQQVILGHPGKEESIKSLNILNGLITHLTDRGGCAST